MKSTKFGYLIILISSIAFLISCTDSSMEDPINSTAGMDTLFAKVTKSRFTGVYDTLGFSLLVNTISQKEYESLVVNNENTDSIRKIVCGDKEGGCMEAMELYAISKVKDKVSRKNNELVLKLNNGKVLTFTNVLADDDSYEVYQFLELDERGYYIVAGYFMESYNYLMINSVNGKITHAIGIPTLSPDKKQYIAGNYDMIAAFTYNGIEFLTIEKDSIRSDIKIDFITWGPEDLKWKNDSTLYVKQKSQIGEDLKESINYAAIRIRKKSSI